MKNLTQFALKRPVTTLMIFVCFVVIGMIASRLLPLEFLPALDVPYVSVNIPYPGSTPEEVERQITRPAEEGLATISGVKNMTSYSRENGANIELEFDWGINANVKALEAREKLDGIRHLFPDDLERFYIHKFSTTDMEIMTIRLSSARDLSNAYDMLNRNLKRRLERLEGVSRVNMYGIEKKELRVALNPDRLIAHKIDVGQLVNTLRRCNVMVTAGRITDGKRRLTVRPMGEFDDLSEIGELIVAGANVRLKDIATITYDMPRLEYGRHLDRKYAIGLDIFKESGANTVDVTNGVIDEIAIIGDLPEMEGIRIYYMDNLGDGIVSSINELLKSGMLGGVLAVLVLYFFLKRMSTTLMVAVAVPLSLLITLAFMYFLNVSLNILSMMGLMLAVGMLVDNAVVVTESIHRHQLLNESREKAIKTGVSEVALAITAGTLTTAIVFLPNIINANDEVAIYIKHVAITICIALGASLILAQTVVPLVTSKVKPPEPAKQNRVILKIIQHYRKIVTWALNHRAATLGIIVLTFLSIAAPISMVKTEMFDEPEDRRIRLQYNITGTYTLEKVEQAVDAYEDFLFSRQDEFEIESVYSYYQPDFASSTILLKKGKAAKKSLDTIQDLIRKDLPRMAIADPAFEYRSTSGQGESIRIQLIGKSSQQLADISREVAWTLDRVNGLQDVRSSAEIGEKEVHVVVDRHRAALYGFSTREIAQVVAAAMRGIRLRRFRNDDGEVEMRLAFNEKERQTLDDLKNLPLLNGRGESVKLASLADFQVRKGPRQIRRRNRTTSINVTANLQDITRSEARKKISNVMNAYTFPPGYTWNYGESFDHEQEAMNTMLVNLLLALALIYFVMAALFESLLFPAAIWTQILFAIVGVYWFFLITGTSMSIMGMIGILILIGVVVNNGIVLIDYVNQLREGGLPRREALIQAGCDRLRPILMTAGTTVLSLVPLCIATTQIGGDGPPYFPMARAMVGGLTFSTLVTLLILPTIYEVLDDLRNWTQYLFAKAGGNLAEKTVTE